MRIAYSKSQMAEAVALAAVIGAEAAAEQLGCDPRSVRGWAARTGHGPEMAVEPDGWRALMDLALARVTARVASGQMRDRDVAVVAGIASRNARIPTPPPDPQTDVARYVDALEAWIAETYPGTNLDAALSAVLGDRRMTDGDPDAPVDIPAIVADLVPRHGSIDAALEWQSAETTRQWQEQVALNRAKAEEMRRVAIEAARDAEYAAILAEVDRVLAEGGSVV